MDASCKARLSSAKTGRSVVAQLGSTSAFREISLVRMPKLVGKHAHVARGQQMHGPEKSSGRFACVKTVVLGVQPVQ